MSSQALTAASPRMSDAPPAPGRVGSHPATLGIASGVLLWFAFPPAAWSWLGWVALAPLFLLVTSRRRRATIYLGAWAGGLAFWLLALSWILCIDPAAALGWGAMSLALSALWPIAVAVARVGVIGLKLPVMVAAPVAWVAVEYVRAYLATGFPWYYLAHTQYRLLPLIQVADFSGALGLSLLMAGANAFLADALTLPLLRPTSRGPRLTRAIAVRAGYLAAALAFTVGYGLFRLGSSKFEPGPRVALLQSNLMQRAKESKTIEEVLAIYAGGKDEPGLVRRAATQAPKPDLIVWSETAYPFGVLEVDPKLPADVMGRLADQYVPGWTAADIESKRAGVENYLHGWVDAIGVPMMVGSTTSAFRPTGLTRYNSAVLIEPGVPAWRSYHKLHLVPFGEYVPLIKTFSWLSALTPYRDGRIPTLAFGEKPSWFDLGKYRYATAICFEDTVPQVVRRLFREVDDGRSPDVLLNLSNDGWFTYLDEDGQVHASSEQEMHLAGSVFRAVEHRVPLARAANTGISAVVDGDGRVVASVPAAVEDVLVREIPLDPRTGLYTAWGDWVGQGCLAISIGIVPLRWWRRRPSPGEIRGRQPSPRG